MKELIINIDTIFKIKTLVNIVSKYEYKIILSSGEYSVNAKSIIGIFTLDISKPIKMTIYNDDSEKLIKEIKEFIIPSNTSIR